MTEDAPVEIVDGNTVWRFDTEFLTSNWTCLFGRGCKGILDHDATELDQGCCSLGAHFGDGPAGEAEAMTVSAYASMLDPAHFQYHHVAMADGAGDPTGDPIDESPATRAPTGSSGTPHDRTPVSSTARASSSTGPASTVARGARCISRRSMRATRPPSGSRRSAGSSRSESTGRRSTTRQNRRPCADGARRDWGDHGRTMAWCCTEHEDGGEAYSGTRARRRFDP